ncbi:MAG TPA: sulfotransferase [Xanthomonadaceae bacterium]|nr:sulfotransferase [Xanthomonadaceae bacterium]
MQILVLGMHRSGTSALARLLNLMGAYFGPEGIGIGANEENPKGFWERRDVRELNDLLLHGAGCDWDRVAGFDADRVPPSVVEEFEARAARLVLAMDAQRPWFLKEPRLCLLLPFWRKFLEAPVAVHIVRHPLEVAASLRKRNGMPVDVGLTLWERYLRSAIDGAAGLPSAVVCHRKLMLDPWSETRSLFRALEECGVRGLRLPGEAEVAAFLRPELYRERAGQDAEAEAAAAPQLDLYRRWLAGDDLRALPDPAAAEQAQRILAAYESGLPALVPRRSTDPETVLKERIAQLQAQSKGDAKRWGEAEAKFRERIGAREQEARTLRERVQALEGQLQAQARRWDTAQETIGGLRAELQSAKEALAAKAQEAAATLRKNERSLAARFQETAALTRLLMESEHRAEQARNALDDSRRELQHARAELGVVRGRLDAVLGSRAWRIATAWRRLRRPRGRAHDERGAHLDLLRGSPYFDPAWYLRAYPDVAASGMDPAAHYLEFGGFEGRDPGPAFDSARYVEQNPDVAAAGMNPLLHFLLHGLSEGRSPK